MSSSLARALLRCTDLEIDNHKLRMENEELKRKLHDATVRYQYLLMKHEPEKAAGMATIAMGGDDEHS